MSNFDASVIEAVTGHMNGDHPEDNLLIVRAFGRPEATESTMTGLDANAGVWRAVDASGEHEVRIDWPGGPIGERPEIRREVVALYKGACEKLGVPSTASRRTAARTRTPSPRTTARSRTRSAPRPGATTPTARGRP